jgi:hypothetical protein
LDLHVALVRLDADLCAARQSIQELMQGCLAHSLHDVGAVQCRLLEDAIRQQEGASLPSRPSTPAAPVLPTGDVPLGIGRWLLRENGWMLVLPDGGGCLALRADERSMLLHVAQSSKHCISGDELHRLLGVAVEHRSMPGRSALDLRMIKRLRRRVSALGAQLPLRAIRGGGYRLASTASSGRSRSSRRAPVPRVSESRSAWISEGAGMRL